MFYEERTLFGLFGKVEIAAKQVRYSLLYFELKVVAEGYLKLCGVVEEFQAFLAVNLRKSINLGL